MSSITIVSDAPNCGVTYNCHYADRNSFIIQATGVSEILLLFFAIDEESKKSYCLYSSKPFKPDLMLGGIWQGYLRGVCLKCTQLR